MLGGVGWSVSWGKLEMEGGAGVRGGGLSGEVFVREAT